VKAWEKAIQELGNTLSCSHKKAGKIIRKKGTVEFNLWNAFAHPVE